ncbi:TauD/TfdA dioxygenase family protein [Streptomyces puniciscabiei]
MPPSIRKLTGRIGAVVEGVDLTAPPEPSTVATLRQARNEHQAIVFDRENLDNAGQERAAARFGELTPAHPDVPAADGTTNVLAVDSETSKADEWHTDVTFVVNPPQVTTLRSLTIRPYGGAKLVANTAAACRDLPEPLRVLANSPRAVHTDRYDHERPSGTTALRQEYDRVFVSTPYEAGQPVVRVQPLTGERGLFIGGFVKRTVGDASHRSGVLEGAA